MFHRAHPLCHVTVLAALVACSGAPTAPAAPPPITAESARTIALAKYSDTLAARLAQQGDHGTCIPFGKITGELELSVERQDDSWLVRHDPMVGYVFSIRVALDGEWAAIEEAMFVKQ